jgi:hypothetical protein
VTAWPRPRCEVPAAVRPPARPRRAYPIKAQVAAFEQKAAEAALTLLRSPQWQDFQRVFIAGSRRG